MPHMAELVGKLKAQASIWQNMVHMGISYVVVILISAPTMVIITRHYGPEEYGAYILASGIIAIISLLGAMGFQFILVRDIAISFAEGPRLLVTSMFVLGLNTILSVGIVLSLSYLVKFNLVLCLWLLAVSMMLNGLILLWSIFRAKEYFRLEARVKIANGFFYFFFVSVLALWLNSGKILHIVVTQFILNLAFFIFAYTRIIKHYGDEFRIHRMLNCIAFDKIAYLYKYGFYMTLISAGVAVYNKVDVIMIGNILDNRAVGIYGVSYRIFEIISGIIVTFLWVLYPRLAKLIKYPEQFSHRIKLIFAVLIGIWVISGGAICWFSKGIILLLFGKDYSEAASVLQILAFVIGLGAISSFLGMLFRILKLEIYMAIITAISACINISLNLYLIPRLEIIGAAWATLFSFLFVVIACLIVLKLPSNQKEPVHYGPEIYDEKSL